MDPAYRGITEGLILRDITPRDYNVYSQRIHCPGDPWSGTLLEKSVKESLHRNLLALRGRKCGKSARYQVQEKEMSLTSVDIRVLGQLAQQKEEEDDLAQYSQSIPAGLSADLKELMEEEAKAKSKSAARILLNLLKKSDEQDAAAVEEIRRLRRQEKSIKAIIEKRHLAKAYGMETNNYLPLAEIVQPYSTSSSCGVKEVPKDWKPKTEAAASSIQQ